MGGDFSRDSFDALKDYAAVLLQQGRPVTDADWNEMVRALLRRSRAATVDIIGRAVVPRETPLGFEVQPAAGSLGIGRGRMYLSGLLIENHGRAAFPGSTDAAAPEPVLDRARIDAGRTAGMLDELISPAAGDFLSYSAQPYWPTPDPLPATGRHLAYVVAWEREVTALEAPGTLEPALGGIDTTTRLQNVWQVRLAAAGQGTVCATGDDALGIPGWADEIAPSTARLTTDTIAIEDPENPCLIPPTDGYSGLENQLYRVELHSVGAAQTDARFKWSRENASVAASVETIAPSGDRITVSRVGHDKLLAFRESDWVELTDDRREFNQRSGQMLRVAVVHQETRELELEATIAADLVPGGGADTLAARHSRLIRWDQRGVVRREDGTPWIDLDAAGSDGLIPVPPAGTRLQLESGIVVAFDTAPAPGRFREMDFWRFAARTAGTQIEIRRKAPPDGVHRHHARLAVVDLPDTRVDDCRVFWPPETTSSGDSDGCFCTVCVTAEKHNSGALTIQDAIAALPGAGGTVCLGAGLYNLREPVTITGRTAVTLRGQGITTLLVFRGRGAAIRIERGIDIGITRLSILATPGTDFPVAGVLAVNSTDVALRQLAVVIPGNPDRQDHGIGVAGISLALTVSECLAAAPIAFGAFTDPKFEAGPTYLYAAEWRVADTILFGAAAGIRIQGTALNLAAAQFDRNLVLGRQTAIRLAWLETASGSTTIAASTIAGTSGDALVLSAGNARIADNDISGGAKAGNGIGLIAGLVKDRPSDVQIIGNRIADLGGAGVNVDAPLATLIVKRNLIRRCGAAGILIGPDASVGWLAIDNNRIAEIAQANQTGIGILAFRIAAGRIGDNDLEAIGPPSINEGAFAGIALRAVGTIAIESNRLGGIGGNVGKSPVAAILVRAPYVTLAVRGNQIDGNAVPADFGRGWAALEIGRATGTGFQPDPGFQFPFGRDPVFPGRDDGLFFVETQAASFVFSPGKLDAAAPRGERQITVTANQTSHAGDVSRPLVSILDGAGGTCIFGENQVRLGLPGEVEAIVAIEAQRIIVANNMARRASERLAMLLNTGANGRATVLGNLTFGKIQLSPGGLAPPFDALNLVAP